MKYDIMSTSREFGALSFLPINSSHFLSVPALSTRVRQSEGDCCLCAKMFQQAFDIDLNLDPLFCAWFSGWVDGEGCFRALVRSEDRSIQPRLSIKVRDDDRHLVNLVHTTIQCGWVRNRSYKYARERGRTHQNDQITWDCTDIHQCRHILVPLFDKYPLRSKKARDYKIWREIVLAVSENHHLNSNRDHILSLCQQLKEVKRYISEAMS